MTWGPLVVLVPDIFTKGQDATVVNSPPLVKEGRLMLVGPPGALLQNGARLGIVLVVPRLRGPQEVDHLRTGAKSEEETHTEKTSHYPLSSDHAQKARIRAPWWPRGEESASQRRGHGFDPWSLKIPLPRSDETRDQPL